MGIASAIREVEPDAVEAVIGRHRIFRFGTATPAHTFESVVAEFGGERLIELTARDSYDERLAEFLLDQAAAIDLPKPRSRSIRVAAADFPAPWGFTGIVVVPPVIARRFEGQSKVLTRVTYWVLPTLDGEFSDGDTGEEFWHQIRRRDKQRVEVICWDRSHDTRLRLDR